MDKSVLELQKLQLELQKMPLEVQKLRAEVDELLLKSQASRSSMRLEPWKVYPLYLTIAVSIAAGTFSYFQQRHQFLEQQEREQKFKVSKELITLVEQISGSSEALQRNAAVELAFFGSPAVPILVENLGLDRERSVVDAILNTLRRILREEKDPQKHADVAAAIIDGVETSIRRELSATRVRVNVLLADIAALGIATADWPLPGHIVQRARSLLAETRGQIAKRKSLDDEDRKILNDTLQAQLAALAT